MTSDSQSEFLISDLQERCETLLAEIDYFRAYLESKRREKEVELRSLRSAVQSEAKALARLAASNPEEERINHTLRSSNLPFYETVWTTAKLSTGVIAFSKRFYWTPPTRAMKHAHDGQASKPTARKLKQYSALVDVVADDGAEWIKVSTVTETRLLFELAKQGWEQQSSGSDSEDESNTSTPIDDDDDDDTSISILKTAESLAKARLATRVRYKHPRVHFVLPKISPNRIDAIDNLLASILATGASLTLATTYPAVPPELTSSLPRLLVNPFADFTPILNIDCTILLALISDLSHTHVPKDTTLHRATRRQIEMEDTQNLLPALLYPALCATPSLDTETSAIPPRELVCTREAAIRMREIVHIIGTHSEKARAEILLGEGKYADAQRQQLLAQWATYSERVIPEDLVLPIMVVDSESGRRADGRKGSDEVQAQARDEEQEEEEEVSDNTKPNYPLPPLATKIAPLLTPLNRSVFLHGWRTGRTTLTSNRTVVKQMEAAIEEILSSGGAGATVDRKGEGPKIWVCGTSRSLVGKEKGRG